jgi:hypothetical protein
MAPPGMGFAVEIPGDTIYKEDNTHPDILAARHDYMVVTEFDAPLYIVSVLDFRPEVRAAMSEDAVFAFGSGLIEDCRSTSVVEHPADVGIRMDVSLTCIGDYHVRGQLHHAGDRLWRVTVGGPLDVSSGADASRFLDSFRLTGD